MSTADSSRPADYLDHMVEAISLAKKLYRRHAKSGLSR